MKSTVPCLQKGDLVGVVALSSLVEPEKLGEAVAFWTNWVFAILWVIRFMQNMNIWQEVMKSD